MRRQGARHQVAVGAGWQWHHDADGAGGVGLRGGGEGACEQQRERDSNTLYSHFDFLPPIFSRLIPRDTITRCPRAVFVLWRDCATRSLHPPLEGEGRER